MFKQCANLITFIWYNFFSYIQHQHSAWNGRIRREGNNENVKDKGGWRNEIVAKALLLKEEKKKVACEE